ncbi:hypothetical protein [Flavobacterium psychrophilum]|uniref:hypothetical protein n=1 Tax=Flavobacterium psychrophilum TaxID=96345 RepID=UPI00106ADE8C|nr:hypothetical protein [Flavobacterium psychrophilum]
MRQVFFAAMLLSVVFTSCKKTETKDSVAVEPGVVEQKVDSLVVKDKAELTKETEETKKIRNWIMTSVLTKDDLTSTDKTSGGFQYDSYDLNGDGQLEYLVKASASYLCGSGGCSLFILNFKFKEIQEFSISSTPIMALATKTKGWNDLLIYSNNATTKDNNHIMKYNGKKYPSNPSVEKGLTDEQLPKDFVKSFFTSVEGAKRHSLEMN